MTDKESTNETNEGSAISLANIILYWLISLCFNFFMTVITYRLFSLIFSLYEIEFLFTHTLGLINFVWFIAYLIKR